MLALRTGPADTVPTNRGQATLLMIVLLFMMVGLAMVVAEVGRLLDESARARTSADAAALAGAAEGEAAAAELAAANGGVLFAYQEHDATDEGPGAVTVAVRVGRALQWARASALVEWHPSG